MTETWNQAKAGDAVVGDVVRTERGDVVVVSRIEESFFGNAEMIALIEDTSERWYKRPLRLDADVEILVQGD
jgi:hypothetical protein